jgi:hypothetical protein
MYPAGIFRALGGEGDTEFRLRLEIADLGELTKGHPRRFFDPPVGEELIGLHVATMFSGALVRLIFLRVLCDNLLSSTDSWLLDVDFGETGSSLVT